VYIKIQKGKEKKSFLKRKLICSFSREKVTSSLKTFDTENYVEVTLIAVKNNF